MTKKKWVLALVIIPLLSALLLAGCICVILVRSGFIQFRTPLPPVQYRLHSTLADLGVIVPFHTQYGRTLVTTVHQKRVVTKIVVNQKIFVTVKIGNKTITAQVDTGCPDSPWPSELKLGHVSQPNANFFTDDGGNRAEAGLAVLPSVWLGSLEIKNMATYSVEDPHPNTSLANQEDVLQLGDAAFAGLVLTIDYPKKELILHRPGYQPSKSALVYPCVWTDKDQLTGGSVPAILGTMEGQPGNAIIDTGWSGNEIGLSPEMYQKIAPILRNQKVPMTTATNDNAYGKATGTFIQRVHWSALGMTVTAPAYAVSHLPAHQDIVLGPGVLSTFRVTIDYPGNRVWLEQEKSPSQTR